MKFGVNANDNVEGNSSATLEPGKYVGATLKSVKYEGDLKKEDGTPLVKRIIFGFETPDGKNHTHIEYEPKADDQKAESKGKNLSTRITHIMSKYYDRANLNAEHESFDAYGNWVASKLQPATTLSVKVDFLIVGNVYNNKASSGFSGYPPFIVKTGEALGFDDNHKKANADYYKFMNAGAASPDVENSETKAIDSDF